MKNSNYNNDKTWTRDQLQSAWISLTGKSLTHVVEPAGDFPVHLVTSSHSDSEHDFGDEACQPRHFFDPHHKLLHRNSYNYFQFMRPSLEKKQRIIDTFQLLNLIQRKTTKYWCGVSFFLLISRVNSQAGNRKKEMLTNDWPAARSRWAWPGRQSRCRGHKWADWPTTWTDASATEDSSIPHTPLWDCSASLPAEGQETTEGWCEKDKLTGKGQSLIFFCSSPKP